MTLTEFLLARIAEDEDEARSGMRFAAPTETSTNIAGDGILAVDLDVLADLNRRRHVLAECEAKRRIVDLHHPEDAPAIYSDRPRATEQICSTCGGLLGEPDCPTLRALVLPHADHPDYRDEWNPDTPTP